ncbi:MAG: ABC transporter ATP-binding protein [Spirochaetia bacterium]|nr:ABC transporter ATP-binding protein [Spirochaetia bacterium]
MDDEKIIRGLDGKITKRLFRYVKPYRGWFILAVAGLILATVGELITPVLLQRSIDRHILVSWSAFRENLLSETEPKIKQILEKSDSPPVNIGERIFVPSDALGIITGREKEELIDKGLLEETSWYVFSLGNSGIDFLSLSESYPGSFIGNKDYAALELGSLKNLSPEDLRQVRKGDFNGLMRYSIFYLLLLLEILIFSFLQVYIMAYISQGVMRDMRHELLEHTFSQSLSFLNSRPVGSLVTRVTSDVETVNELFTSVATSLLRDIFVMTGVIFVLFTLNVRLATITVITLPPVFILTWFFRSRAREAYRQVRLWVSKVNGFLSEHISGMEIIQMFSREKKISDDFYDKNKKLLKAELGEMYVFAAFRPLIDFFTSVSTGAIIYFGAQYFTNSTLSLGVLIAFVNLVGQFYRPVMDISEKFNIMQSAMAGSERVFDLLDSNSSIPDNGKINADNFRGEIEFRNVNFSYNPGEPVLKNLSFKLNPGETVAVVGYTGAGKTTIASLAARFWDTGSGNILIDGRDIREYSLDSLRKCIQTVQQEVFLFSGTLEENITLGKKLSREELEKAAEAVQADRFISTLPDGFSSVVKEGGANFSAGQRQLISFARIIAHDPKVVILDEATASVDTETEKLIQLALSQILKERTSLVIAHRLSTIRHADRILVLNDGNLVEEGSHDKLMDLKGAYFNLYQLQYEKNGAN